MTYLKIYSFWFKDYVSNRTQSVRIGEVLSNKLDISYGVPQGSILGPILFSIFVNDMKKLATKCILVQYADDAQFIHSGEINNIEELVERAEETLTLTKQYFDRNGLLINSKKTQCIFIGTRQYISRIPDNITINYDGNRIVPSKHVKNLGVYMDCHMSFHVHIDEMNKKVMGTLLYINRIKDNFDKTTRIAVIETLVLSQIKYCCKLWGIAGKTQLQKVQKLQNFGAKVADGKARKFDHVTPIIKELKWIKIEQQYVFEICIFVFKILRGKLPPWLIALPTVGQAIQMRTRQVNDLFIPRFNTDMGSRTTNVQGPIYWNMIPDCIKNTCSLPNFKKTLKQYILEQF